MSVVHSLRSVGSHWAILLCVLTTPVFSSGCGAFGSPGPSLVGQGRRYTAGHPDFDKFFAELHAVQVELANAPRTQADQRAELAQALGIDPASDPGTIAQTLRGRTNQIAGEGVHLRLKLPELAQVAHDSAPQLEHMGSPSDQDLGLLRLVEKTAKNELVLIAQMRQSRQRIEAFSTTVATLEPQLDPVFRKSIAKKAEVRKNLDDAKQLFVLLAGRAQEVSASAEQFLPMLKHSVDHGEDEFDKPPPPPPPPEPEPEPEPPPKKKGKGSKPAPPAPPPPTSNLKP